MPRHRTENSADSNEFHSGYVTDNLQQPVMYLFWQTRIQKERLDSPSSPNVRCSCG